MLECWNNGTLEYWAEKTELCHIDISKTHVLLIIGSYSLTHHSIIPVEWLTGIAKYLLPAYPRRSLYEPEAQRSKFSMLNKSADIIGGRFFLGQDF